MTETKSRSSAWDMIKLGLILAVYAAVSCTILAVVNSVTSPVIAKNEIEKANAAMKSVLSEADSFEQVTDFEGSSSSSITIDSVYLAKKGNDVIGAVVQVSGPTYDHGTIMVGVDTEETVTGVQFLKLSDTPGFGLKASDSTYKVASGSTFYGQFAGKKVSDGFIVNKTFDAVSGATITSNGVAALLTEGTKCACTVLSRQTGRQ